MSSDSSVDPQAVEQTKQQIRGLVEEISALTKQGLRPEEFYNAFLQRVVEALAAVGGAVWIVNEGNRFQLAYQINLRKSSLDEQGDHQIRHARLLAQVTQTGEGLLVPPHSGGGDEGEGANPTEMLLVLAPMRSDQRVEGVIEIFQRPTANPATRRGYLRFLLQMCELASDWHKTYKLQQFTDQESLWTEIDEFARAVHETLDLRGTAYTLANEAQRLIGCDRVSVAVRRGNRCIVEAVSGQDLFDPRSNVVTLLGKLATKVVSTGDTLWFTGSTEDYPPQIEEAIQEYVDHSHAKTIAVLPISKPTLAEDVKTNESRDTLDDGTAIGALIVEQIEDVRSREQLSQRVDLVCSHGGRALSNAYEHNNVFLMPLWRSIGRARWLVRAKTLPKTLAVLIGVLTALLALIFVPADFDLKGQGELQPVIRQDVFCEQDGTVIKVIVQSGKTVHKGDKLVQLQNPDLEVRLFSVQGELRSTSEQLRSVLGLRNIPGQNSTEKNSLAGQALQLRAKIASLEETHTILIRRFKELTVTSPIDGQVITWDLENLLLYRPTTKGQVLMSIADPTEPWELIIYMPENRMGHIDHARKELGDKLKVEYISATDPKRHLQGTVREIHTAAQLHDEHGHSVRIVVDIDKKDLKDPRPGASVTAKVHCGRRSIGYVWLHDLFEWFQSRVLFHIR